MQPTTPKKTLYLIDGSSYLYRAFYALGRLTNSRGMPTQAIYGFAQMLTKVMRDKKPDYLCVVFDPPGPTHRHAMYEAYKATRQKMPEDLVTQVPYIKELVRVHGVARVEQEGYEADDVIATLTQRAVEHALEVVIVSGDKDLLQLVSDPEVRQWDPQKDRIFTEEGVAEKFGVVPRQMVDYLALVGDSSDNVPGVKGVGEKTAKQLLQHWASLDEIFHHVAEVTPASLKAKLLGDQASAYLSRQLVTLKTDVAITARIDDFEPGAPLKSELLELYRELDFKGFREALEREWGTCREAASSGQPDALLELKTIQDQRALDELLKLLEGQSQFALRLDTTAANPMRAELTGMAISFENHTAFYLDLSQSEDSRPGGLTSHQVLAALTPVLSRPEIGKVGHDLKNDWIVLQQHDVHLKGIAFDTMVASYLLQPGQQAHDLARLAGEHLGEPPDTFPERRTRSQELTPPASPDIRRTAAGRGAEVIWRLVPGLREKLREANQEHLLTSLEQPLISILAAMESRGILVDTCRLETLAAEMQNAMGQKAATIFDLAKEEFNIQSPKQLAAILFEKLGLPVVKKTKSGPSTDSSVLEELVAAHPIVEQVLSYRTLAKLRGTYAEVLPRLIHPRTRRLHTSFNQAVTATGRLSSSDPNLQNIPIRTEEGRKIREAFIPSPEHVLLSADYSQIELRILAHFSRDERLLEAFHSDGDVHRQTAAEMYNLPQHEVTPEMRRQAKTINFGIIYGMGAFGLARRLGITRAMARGMIERYFDRYRGVRSYIDTVVEAARQSGYTETILGRRRPIPELSSRNHNIRQQGERLAINSPIQGSAADLIKKAMIEVAQTLKEKRLATVMLLQVHDELVFEVPVGELEAAKGLVLERMEHVAALAVPLKVELGWGENWAQAHA